jgi:hypothetical protein
VNSALVARRTFMCVLKHEVGQLRQKLQRKQKHQKLLRRVIRKESAGWQVGMCARAKLVTVSQSNHHHRAISHQVHHPTKRKNITLAARVSSGLI